MISPAVFLLGTLAAAFVVAAGDVRLLDSLADHCRFSLDGQVFDLCPILSANEGDRVYKTTRQTPPTIMTVEYRFNLQNPLTKISGVPNHEQVSQNIVD